MEKPSPKYESLGRRSHRFKSICRFLENVVRIVPVESICSAVMNTKDENAWKCAEALACCGFDPPPSLMFLSGLECAHMQLNVGINPLQLEFLMQEALKGVLQKAAADGFTGKRQIKGTLSVEFNEREVFVRAEPGKPNDGRKKHTDDLKYAFADVVKGQVPYSPQHGHTVGMQRKLSLLGEQAGRKSSILQKLEILRNQMRHKCAQEEKSGTLQVICNLSIAEFYPASENRHDTKSSTLKPPIAVLVSAKQKLRDLQAKAEEEILARVEEEDSVNKMKAQHNEQMVRIIDSVIGNELSICVTLLGAFMEEQMRVPFINSPQETAHILQTTQTPSSVGVWALFSLKMLDMQAMLRSKKGKTLVVKVQNYIQGILSKRGRDPYQNYDHRYAGKLQFLMQGMVSTVSCNTNYISYSLERQLHDSCKHFKITPKTRVNDLVKEWDKTFKNNVLFHVMQPYRPLLARWLIWSLNIHQLREELASHTTVGIVGLSNSGKSSLVSSLFNQKVNINAISV